MKTSHSYPKTRPKSFSEGYNVADRFPKEELNINDYNEIPNQIIEIKTNYCGIIYMKLLGFVFHLLLISAFEVVFFNYYIIQYENNALITLSDSLVNPITNSCQNLSNITKIKLDQVINILINETTINNDAMTDFNTRQNFNNTLYINSIIYSVVIILVFFFLLSLNYIFKQKIDFYMVILDNIIMITMLGIYEYLFFTNIVFKYMTISPNELIKNIMVNLLQKC